MAKAILIVGKLCSGKSTYAERLKRELGAIVLSVDELMLALFPEGAGEHHDLYVRRVKEYLLNLSLSLIGQQVSVVLEWGFWTKAQRDEVRSFYTRSGADFEFHMIDIDPMEWQRRIERRNTAMRDGAAGSYYVDDGLLRKFEALYEPPEASEMAGWIRVPADSPVTDR